MTISKLKDEIHVEKLSMFDEPLGGKNFFNKWRSHLEPLEAVNE